MKVELKKRENYSSIFISLKVPFVNKTFRWHMLFYNTPNAWVHGYSSRTEKGKYVLFHDYDNLDLEAIEGELKYLQQRYNLSDYYIFKLDRDDSFHAVCIDTFPLCRTFEILKSTSCDNAFIHSIKRLQSREWILRFDKKGERGAPKYLKTIPSRNRRFERSSAHAKFLKILGVPIISTKGKGWDNCKKVALVDYNTSNRIK